jgi:hypothetical protein
LYICVSLISLLSFFVLPLYCMSFFELRLLITPLVISHLKLKVDHGCEFYWWRKPKFPAKTTVLSLLSEQLWPWFELTTFKWLITKGVIRSRNSKKDMQYNGNTKKDKREISDTQIYKERRRAYMIYLRRECEFSKRYFVRILTKQTKKPTHEF